jgi:hypothetical protein
MTAMAGNRAIVLNRNFIQNLEDPKKSFIHGPRGARRNHGA